MQFVWLGALNRMRVEGPPGVWVFMGAETRAYDLGEVEKRLSGWRRASIASEIDAVAQRIRQPTLDLLDRVAAAQLDSVAWWSSILASRSPSACDFFLFVCFLTLVNDWAAGLGTRPDLVVVGDPWLYAAVTGCGASRRVIRWTRVQAVLRVVAVQCYLAAWGLAAILLARVLRLRADRGRFNALLFTWVDASCFAAQGEFVDRHLPRVADALEAAGLRPVRIAPVRIRLRDAILLRRRAPSFIISAAYLRVRDIFAAATSIFRIAAVPRTNIGTADVSLLLERELWNERSHPWYGRQLMWRRALETIAADVRTDVRMVVYPFENQPWEHVFCAVFRRHIPDVRIIGVQHTMVGRMSLEYSPLETEATHGVLPDLIVASGRHSRDILIEAGIPSDRIVVGGAPRFEYLHAPRPDRLDAAGNTVLVALPIVRREASDLLTRLVHLGPLATANGGPVQFVVKAHPDLPLESIDAAGTLPPWITTSKEPLSQLLPRCRAFLFAPPTATWWEAWVCGVPVLKYRTDTVDIESVSSREAVIACTADTLADSIRECLNRPTARPSERRAALEFVFPRFQPDVWASLLAAR